MITLNATEQYVNLFLYAFLFSSFSSPSLYFNKYSHIATITLFLSYPENHFIRKRILLLKPCEVTKFVLEVLSN